MFSEILSQYVNLRDEQLNQFQKFYDLVIDWNTKINLTAITDEKEFAIKHVMDSLTLWDEEKFAGVKKILDVGTGAGFPAIPLFQAECRNIFARFTVKARRISEKSCCGIKFAKRNVHTRARGRFGAGK